MNCPGLHSTSATCGTDTCEKTATTRVHWPGNTLDMCGTCALRAANVANAMGFNLTTEPLKERTTYDEHTRPTERP